MKNLARLTVLFSLSFAVLFLAAILLGLLSFWIDSARFIPVEAASGKDAAALAWRALPSALYLAVLLALSYTARRNMPVFFSMFCVFALGCALAAAASLGISRFEALKPALRPVSPIEARPGLLLSRFDNRMILLKGSGDIRGPRVVSIPGRPLIYQETPLGPNNTVLSVPPLPLGVEPPWFVRSLDVDFSLAAAEMKSRLDANFVYFAAYAFSLILLLSSLRFLMELSQWPLANLFLGALVFRLILSLEIFLDAGEINGLLVSFLNGRMPSRFAAPAVFGALAVFFMLYTLLARAARAGEPRASGPRTNAPRASRRKPGGEEDA